MNIGKLLHGYHGYEDPSVTVSMAIQRFNISMSHCVSTAPPVKIRGPGE